MSSNSAQTSKDTKLVQFNNDLMTQPLVAAQSTSSQCDEFSKAARTNSSVDDTSISAPSSTDETALKPPISSPPSKPLPPAIARLPSRNISFSSAEVLSVSEVLQHAQSLSQQNFSARIVGILTSHCPPGKFLTVEDPCKKHSQANPYRQSRPLTVSSKKRKIVHTPTGLKGSLSNQNKKDGPIISPSAIIVDVSAVLPLRDCTVNDTVMIIGEMRLLPSSFSQESETISSEFHNAVWNRTKPNCRGCYLQARIVNNCNRMDVNLFYESVRLRREFLGKKGWKGVGCGLPKKEEGESVEGKQGEDGSESCVRTHSGNVEKIDAPR